MNRVALVFLTAVLAACGGEASTTSSAAASGKPASAKPASTGSGAKATASAATTAAPAEDDFKTVEDFEEEAEKDITSANLTAELDAMAKEIDADP